MKRKPETEKCPHCDSIWKPRVRNPMNCPRCHKPIRKRTADGRRFLSLSKHSLNDAEKFVAHRLKKSGWTVTRKSRPRGIPDFLCKKKRENLKMYVEVKYKGGFSIHQINKFSSCRYPVLVVFFEHDMVKRLGKLASQKTPDVFIWQNGHLIPIKSKWLFTKSEKSTTELKKLFKRNQKTKHALNELEEEMEK